MVGTPQKLRWTYSDAKALEEATAYSLFLTKKLKVTTVRFFNIVGPRQTGRYGMVIPRFVQAALENRPISIFGDGFQSRVFCHVDDATKATILLSLDDSSIGEVFNIGGIGETSILNLANTIREQLKSESAINFMNYEDVYPIGYEDMQRRVPDISKIKKHNGWEPELNLKDIIDDVTKSFTNTA